jgi:hypothetical protein
VSNSFNFETVLPDLDAGAFSARLSAAVAATAEAVVHTGKKGSVTITLAFERIGEGNQVMIDHTLKMVEPKARGKITDEDTTKTPMYVGARGALSIAPESQADLFMNRRETAE